MIKNYKNIYNNYAQTTGKRKPADKTGIQNDVLKSDMKERSKRLISKDSQNLTGLTKYLSEIKNTKMEEEYKVGWTKYRQCQAGGIDITLWGKHQMI